MLVNFLTIITPSFMNTFLRVALICLVFSLFSFQLKAQSKPTLIKTKYAYTFSGEASSTTIENLTQEILNLKGVTTCKPVFKPEQHKGQIIVFVEEYTRTSEGDVLFEPTDLKKIIIKNGLLPDELITEEQPK
ncbi:MAG: hypothetical protein HS119_13755 [Flavobacteriales bacterium]|nr:hypothetical protein [Flavobacteriales bacterium]